ncbi:MAG: DUF4326 domain-containing protein [Deltaproteobacteria bacterium]|nr:DUF4326 domain-containing protein [Deltaproteobacteria bacterium]
MKRIQRKRTKGWIKPNNSIIVDRTSKYGNPIKIIGNFIFVNAKYRRKFLDKWVILDEKKQNPTIDDVLLIYKSLITGDLSKLKKELKYNKDVLYWKNYYSRLDFSALKGKDLICFCSLNKKCHADILLQLFN